MTSAICVNGGTSRANIVKAVAEIMMITLRKKVIGMKCENCIHYGVCVVNSYCHEPCGYYEEDRPRGEWKEFTVSTYRGTDEWGEPKWGKSKKFICKRCGRRTVIRENFCPNCGADMQANDRQVTGKLNSETEYKAKVKELEDAIARCERAEKEFKSRTCKFRSPINCDFCAFHSECEEHWKEGEKE